MEAGLRINRYNCEFAFSSVTYLGYLLDKEGLRSDPESIKPVLTMASPKNTNKLKRVLGMFGWYSRCLENEV